MVDVGILSSKTRDRVWCPGLGEPRMGLQSPPRPACPGTWLFRAAELFFLCSYAQGRESLRGPALCGPWTCPGGKTPEKSFVPAQNSSELGRPHPGEGLSPSLLRPVPGADHSRAALLVLRLWPRPSTQRRGEGKKGREEGREGGPWRLRGAGGRGGVSRRAFL